MYLPLFITLPERAAQLWHGLAGLDEVPLLLTETLWWVLSVDLVIRDGSSMFLHINEHKCFCGVP